MGMPAGQRKYSYAHYLTWDETDRCEVIDGDIISMSPSPTPQHQAIAVELTAEFTMYLRGKECRVFAAPIEVCLFADRTTRNEDIIDWVQPDLVVVCDKDKIGQKNIVGAPDLVVEVLSPSTAKNDRLIKFKSYEKAGVREYWIVDPYNHSVEVYLGDGGSFKPSGVYFKDDILPVGILEEMRIELENVFRVE
ncbi:Uma2 family endonuclease [Ammoniphilus sp. YIM 78166]|uniref:Uma2 family endonuclease n=1 Tax=Ammoniphilus sp. YIM 78166 TaxID=1644106 RepID=UPI001F0F5C39|nr:Uma2 family endonuclease [Ammoniphilus sp. YIM 78166]